MLLSVVNSFHYIRYLSISHIFLLFSIFLIFYSSTFSTSIGFSVFFFCFSTCSLYYTIQLTFITRFLTGLFLNIKSLVLNNIFSPFFQALLSFLLLSACLFIFSYTFFRTTSTSFCTFFILSTNLVAFFTFLFFLMSSPILNSFP